MISQSSNQTDKHTKKEEEKKRREETKTDGLLCEDAPGIEMTRCFFLGLFTSFLLSCSYFFSLSRAAATAAVLPFFLSKLIRSVRPIPADDLCKSGLSGPVWSGSSVQLSRRKISPSFLFQGNCSGAGGGFGLGYNGANARENTSEAQN